MVHAIEEFLDDARDQMQRDKVSNAELARRLHINRANVSQIMNGHRNLTFATADAIAKALGLSFHARLSGKEG